MDEFDENVETSSEGQGSKLGMIAVLIGIVGIVVGVTGIIMANQSQKAVKTLQAELAAQPDRTPELEKSMDSMDERLERLGSEFVKLGRADRQLQDNTQAAFDSVIRDVKTNRDGINQVTEKMTELVTKLENWKPAKPVSRAATVDTEESGSGDAAADVATAEEGVYRIQSGDTLSGIAKKFGVTLSRLQAVNPTVNPRALQIGQKIVIPEP